MKTIVGEYMHIISVNATGYECMCRVFVLSNTLPAIFVTLTGFRIEIKGVIRRLRQLCLVDRLTVTFDDKFDGFSLSFSARILFHFPMSVVRSFPFVDIFVIALTYRYSGGYHCILKCSIVLYNIIVGIFYTSLNRNQMRITCISLYNIIN